MLRHQQVPGLCRVMFRSEYGRLVVLKYNAAVLSGVWAALRSCDLMDTSRELSAIYSVLPLLSRLAHSLSAPPEPACRCALSVKLQLRADQQM